MTLQTFSPTCYWCSRPLAISSPSKCSWCGANQTVSSAGSVPLANADGRYSPQFHRVVNSTVAAKTPGIAVLLSLLWLGAGHLYANRNATGVILAIAELFLVLLSFTVVGLFLTVPIWLVATPIVMVLSAQAVTDFNRRNGTNIA